MGVTLRNNKGSSLTFSELDQNFLDFMDLSASGATRTLLGIRAPYKSFLIDHPTRPGMKLQYGSLEGPEHGVYVRGKLENSSVIQLPEYWTKLVDPNSITVQLTPIGRDQKLYVDDIRDNKVYVRNDSFFVNEIRCFYLVQGERVDVEKLAVEIVGDSDGDNL